MTSSADLSADDPSREAEPTARESRPDRTDAAVRRRPASARGGDGTRWWSPRNVSALYLWILMIVIFALWSPDQFFAVQTFKDILNQNAVVGLAALILAAPLACGALDLSIGAMMGLGGVTVAVLIGQASMPVGLAVVVTVVVCALFGLVNSLVVVGLRVNALIATLATSLLFFAAQIGLSDNSILTDGLQGSFLTLAQGSVLGVTYPVLYLLGLTLVLVYLLERAPVGRKIYATGYDAMAARLAGIPVNRVKVVAFIATAAVAGFAGIVAAARVQAATPTNGVEYLFPAITAVFLGATQFRNGRFNPWGTLVSVLVIGTGEAGLVICGAPSWSPDVFTAVLLITAVGAAAARRGGGEISMSGI